MTKGVAGFIAVGIIAAVLLGIAAGFDPWAVILLGLISATGAVAIATTRKAERGETGPRSCPHCAGLISPNAPYCKHCNEVL
jgi:F0F1-type ATP synthase assembly protein I